MKRTPKDYMNGKMAEYQLRMIVNTWFRTNAPGRCSQQNLFTKKDRKIYSIYIIITKNTSLKAFQPASSYSANFVQARQEIIMPKPHMAYILATKHHMWQWRSFPVFRLCAAGCICIYVNCKFHMRGTGKDLRVRLNNIHLRWLKFTLTRPLHLNNEQVMLSG